MDIHKSTPGVNNAVRQLHSKLVLFLGGWGGVENSLVRICLCSADYRKLCSQSKLITSAKTHSTEDSFLSWETVATPTCLS